METGSPWVVLKFGGTSVSTRECWRTIASVAQERLKEGYKPVLVCSAVSGISNKLEELLETALQGKQAEVLSAIKARHAQLLRELELPLNLLDEPLDRLERLALGVSLVREVSPRVHAEVLAQGELMSTRAGAHFFSAQGLSAAWIDARDCLQSRPDHDLRRHYVSATCPHEYDEALHQRLSERTEKVLITQGFIARTPEGNTALLGRGGSDTSAAYLSARIGASRCEIWTDVPGMFSANPRAIPDARLLYALDYDEAQEIASTGAKVLHPRCIPPVRGAEIELHVRCTSRPDLQGTVVSASQAKKGAHVKAISSRKSQTLVVMETPGMWQQVGFLADIFACFKQVGLSIDLVSTSEMNVTVTLDPASNDLSEHNLSKLSRMLSPYCQVRIVRACAAVSLVGHKIRTIMHQLGPALELFEEQRIHLVSQAASDLNLTFVVDEDQAERLVRKLHWLFFKATSPGEAFGPTWEELFAPQNEAPTTTTSAQRPWWIDARQDLLELGRARSPRYVYHGATLDRAANDLLGMDALDRVFFAIKANPCAEILRRFYAAGLGFECVSPGEVEHVQALFPEIDPARILFTPNFAPKEEYQRALDQNLQVTLDNLHPLESWPEIFENKSVLVRIDPGQGRGHHDYVKTAGKTSKFGVSPEEIDRLEALAWKHSVTIVGLHAHCGSGILTPDNWSDTALSLLDVAKRFPSVKILNLGGGLGVPEDQNQAPLDIAEVNASLKRVHEAHPGYKFWMEPGRYLVAQAGVLLAKVTQLKDKGEVRYIGIDAGMNSLIRPALYGAFHEIVNLDKTDAPTEATFNIVGPICETGDTLGYNRRMPAPGEGDVILIATAGAYGRAMGSHYNLRPPAEEVLLD